MTLNTDSKPSPKRTEERLQLPVIDKGNSGSQRPRKRRDVFEKDMKDYLNTEDPHSYSNRKSSAITHLKPKNSFLNSINISKESHNFEDKNLKTRM